MNDLPYELLELLRSLRGNPRQAWRHDPSDRKTVEFLVSGEWKGDLIRGRDLAGPNKPGDIVEVSATEAHELVKAQKAAVVTGGYVYQVIFDTEPSLGFVPWDEPASRGVVLNDTYDKVFVPVVLSRSSTIASGFVAPGGTPFWLQWGYVQRAGWQTRSQTDWRPHTFTILSLEEARRPLCPS
jgi:hypothetical protein